MHGHHIAFHVVPAGHPGERREKPPKKGVPRSPLAVIGRARGPKAEVSRASAAA